MYRSNTLYMKYCPHALASLSFFHSLLRPSFSRGLQHLHNISPQGGQNVTYTKRFITKRRCSFELEFVHLGRGHDISRLDYPAVIHTKSSENVGVFPHRTTVLLPATQLIFSEKGTQRRSWNTGGSSRI